MSVLNPIFLNIDSFYGADELGLPYRDIMGEGVVGEDDLAVSEKASGANMSVDVAAGAAWVAGDDDADAQPTYRLRNDATVNVTIEAADATNPRIDLVVARVYDSAFAGVSDTGTIEVVKGTAAGTPSAPSLPNNAIELAQVAVAASATTIEDADITDSRVRATVGGGSAQSGAGSGTAVASVTPISLANPGSNAFWTVLGLTDWNAGHWEFTKDVAGTVYGFVKVPDSVTDATVRLMIAANATSGVSRLGISWAAVAEGETLNPGALTNETDQDITVPATAYLRKDVTFDLTGLSGGDLLIVQVRHEGAHANDTLAVNTLLLGAWLEPAS